MIDDLDSNAELYPSWRQALVCFREAGFKPGDIIPHTWFYEQFDCAALTACGRRWGIPSFGCKPSRTHHSLGCVLHRQPRPLPRASVIQHRFDHGIYVGGISFFQCFVEYV